MVFKSFIQRYQLAIYFVLAFSISWGGVALLIRLQGFQLGNISNQDAMLWGIPMLAGPSLAGILMTAAVGGAKGMRELLSSFTRWRVGLGWWVIAAFSNPMLVIASYSALAVLVSPIYRIEFKPGLFILGMAAGFFEEIGWTGFVMPRIAHRPDWLPWAIGLGFLHGVWHLLVFLLGSAAVFGDYWLPYFLVFWVGAVAAYRVPIVWVYKHTESLSIGMLMHMVFTGAFLVFEPSLAPAEQLLWGLCFASVLWVIVAVLVAVGRKPALQTEEARSLKCIEY